MEFESERVMWAELRNEDSRFLVASVDWQSILGRLGNHWVKADDRWDDATHTWLWTASEATLLAARLESERPEACRGIATVDLTGEYASGSTIIPVDDGLSNRERTSRLVAFLRCGEFRWRFVTEDWRDYDPGLRAT